MLSSPLSVILILTRLLIAPYCKVLLPGSVLASSYPLQLTPGVPAAIVSTWWHMTLHRLSARWLKPDCLQCPLEQSFHAKPWREFPLPCYYSWFFSPDTKSTENRSAQGETLVLCTKPNSESFYFTAHFLVGLRVDDGKLPFISPGKSHCSPLPRLIALQSVTWNISRVLFK